MSVLISFIQLLTQSITHVNVIISLFWRSDVNQCTTMDYLILIYQTTVCCNFDYQGFLSNVSS